MQIFYEHGYSGATVRQIVGRADVQIPTLYHHFTNRQGLLLAIMDRTLRASTAFIESSLVDVEGPDDRLRTALTAHIDWHISNQQMAFIADAELSRLTSKNKRSIIRLRDGQERIFREILDQGLETGAFQISDSALFIGMRCQPQAVWQAGPDRTDLTMRRRSATSSTSR